MVGNVHPKAFHHFTNVCPVLVLDMLVRHAHHFTEIKGNRHLQTNKHVGLVERTDAACARIVDKNGNVENIQKAVFSDSIATIVGSIFGTSNTTSYIESGAGIKEGGKTGLVAVSVGIFFLLCLFLAPLAKSIPAYATGAALVFIATFFCKNLVNIDWDDISEYSPALLAAFIMPLTFSISNGIALAFIVYVVAKAISGKMSDLNPAVLIIAAASLLHFLL